MKKVFLIVCSLFVFAAASNAQQAQTTDAKVPTKEEREKMKQKQEEELAAAFKEIGLTDEQIAKVKAVNQEANDKNKALRADNSISDDDKKAKMKENNDAKNAKLKEIMGEEKYKQFTAIRKKQRDAAQAGQQAGN